MAALHPGMLWGAYTSVLGCHCRNQLAVTLLLPVPLGYLHVLVLAPSLNTSAQSFMNTAVVTSIQHKNPFPTGADRPEGLAEGPLAPEYSYYSSNFLKAIYGPKSGP